MQPSLISSFSVNGIREAFPNWPPNVICELYCFMHADLEFLFPTKTLPRVSASEIMAAYADNIDVIKNCADLINHLATSNNVLIGSLATYLPEISHWDSRRRESSVCAAKFCVSLASELNKFGHPVECMELVLGSRAQGVFPGAWKNRHNHTRQPVVGINKVRSRESHGYALESLRSIATFINDLKLSLKLALEMEPGPLNVLSGVQSVLDLVHCLKDDVVDRVIGLNIDLAHWAIISRNDPAILHRISNRIHHAHIAEHATGIHFGDLPIRNNGTNSAILQSWLHYLFTASSPVKYVSVELEAVKSMDEVRVSVETLQAWMGLVKTH